MKLYLENGYLDVDSILKPDNFPFTFIIGARGVGKTYGVLEYIYANSLTSIILRRTQVQADLLSNKAFQPYKQLNADKGWNIGVDSVAKNVTGLYNMDDEGKKTGSPFGYICALSTFSNLRGFDASDIRLIFYDEFIPESNAKPIRMEYETLLNMYETVNRNRELNGLPPVKLVCCANSNTIDNPYFIGLGIVNKIASLQSKGKSVYMDVKRGLLVINLAYSPISKAKSDTALYRLSGEGNFSDMALGNIYSGVDYAYIKHCPIVEYIPRYTIGEITIYKHKSKNEFYVSTHKAGSPSTYTSSTDDIERFRQANKLVLGMAYYYGTIFFEDAISQVLFRKYALE